MANSLDVKVVIKHLANGTLGENLCIICLEPLGDQYENIFTTICKEDHQYSVADILQQMCQVTFAESDADIYNACIECFMMASVAYRFYLKSKRSNEILNFYSDELLSNVDQVVLPEEELKNTLCISVPLIETETPVYEFDLNGIHNKPKDIAQEKIIQKVEKIDPKLENIKKEKEDDIVIIVEEKGVRTFHKVGPDGQLVPLTQKELSKIPANFKKDKRNRKRCPMTIKLCTHCPAKYRFISKLKDHMKQEHNIDLFVCKVCKAITENEQEYHSHLKTHHNIHQCVHCNTVFKKRDTIINHLKWHEKMNKLSQSDGAHICEVCGVILPDEESLRLHYDRRHYKKFTCYYCGRMYKGEISLEMHIKKHEAKMAQSLKSSKPDIQATETEEVPSKIKKLGDNKNKFECKTCQRFFVDERALMWHQRLHNNERPYICEVCGRGFISVNRRNQHSLCAHTAPTRRCPLCPALFHLRSMVNTHIKKVHLKAHKRRNRISKHQNVFWRTEPVPIQELSVDIQNDILEVMTLDEDQLANHPARTPFVCL